MSEPIEVAAAVTYNPVLDKFLVLKRADSMETFPGYWDFPSGKLDDDLPKKAALRELKEETGMTGQVVRSGDSFSVDTEHGEYMVNPFLVMVDEEEVEMSREHVEYRWIDIEEFEDLETVKGLERDLESVGVLDE